MATKKRVGTKSELDLKENVFLRTDLNMSDPLGGPSPMAEELEQGDAPTQDPNPTPTVACAGGSGRKGSPCEECGAQPWKYRCPGCGRLTCSLPCVQSHKRRTACSGKRPRIDPVPLSRFDDNHLISDYNLLEETKQARDSAHRLIAGFGGNYSGYLPKWLHLLRNAARRRGIRLAFLPRGMTKRERNRSRYDRRKNCIYWTLEWRFNSTDVVLIDHDIFEHTSLLSLLEKHLSPSPWNDQLTPYRNAELPDLKLFIQKSAKESKSPYRQLNVEEPLGPQLRSILIVEHPIINIFLPSDSFDFEVEKMANKLARDEKPPGHSTNSLNLKGTEFSEEEIEERELASETHVIDLQDYGTSLTSNIAPAEAAPTFKIHSKNEALVASCVDNLPSNGVGAHEEELNRQSKLAWGDPKTKSCTKVHPLDSQENLRLCSEDGNLDFEEEVRGAYSELVGEMNPDDFLCFDLDLMDEDESMEVSYPPKLWEDLEEGEIPGF